MESFNAVVTQHPFLRGEVYFNNNIVINWPPGSVILLTRFPIKYSMEFQQKVSIRL